MKLTHALSALPFLGILVGIFFANRTEPFVLGLPFALFWVTLWVVTKQGAMAGIVAGVGMVAAMSFAGATPETSSTVDSFIGGLPPFLAQLNLGIVALVVNLIVMMAVSAATRGTASARSTGRFERSEQVEWSTSR